MNDLTARRARQRGAARRPYTRVPLLHVRETSSPARHVIVATGPIDIAGAPTLAAALERAIASRRKVLVDLSAVTFLATAGLAVLLDARHRLAAHGGELTLAGPSQRIRRLLQVTGNDRLLKVTGGDRLLHLEPTGRAASNASTRAASGNDRAVSTLEGRATS